MGKYKHTVTGKVGEYNDSYAEAVSALERVDDDTEVSPCIDCGPPRPETTAGVVSVDVEEPITEPSNGDEGD